MSTIRIKYGTGIPGWANAWNHAAEKLPYIEHDDENYIDYLYDRLIKTYKQFEYENHCKFTPDYHEIHYIEFESAAHYNWFLLRWL